MVVLQGIQSVGGECVCSCDMSLTEGRWRVQLHKAYYLRGHNTTAVFPTHRKRQQKEMEWGVWEAPPLYSVLEHPNMTEQLLYFFRWFGRIESILR